MITSMIRPMIRSMVSSMIPSDVESRVLIDGDSVLNAHYELSSAITFAGDFEVSIDLYDADISGSAGIVADSNSGGEAYRLRANGGSIRFDVRNAANSGFSSAVITPVNNSRITIARTGEVISITDGVTIDTQDTTSVGILNNEVYFGTLGRRGVVYLDGILADAVFNDIDAGEITTFRLDEATANTENSVEGNNSVTYVNIPESIRDTYTLVDDGVNWIGSELVVNGTFDTDSDWAKGAGWTISGGELVGTSVASFVLTSQAIGISDGNSYAVDYSLDLISGNFYAEFGIGGLGASGEVRTVTGEYSELLMPNTGNTSVLLRANSLGFTGSIDNVSVKRLIEIA